MAGVIISGGCASTGFFGHSSNQVDKQANKITEVQNKINNNKDDKIFQAKDFSFGTGYALNKSTNTEPAITVAKEMNERVQHILGLPDFEQQKEMVSLVNGLISNNIAAKYALYQKDKDIMAIQEEETFLLKAKDKEIKKALDLSASVALKADSSQKELDKYQGWFGLSAVAIGLKQFATTSFWVLLGSGIVFLVLRILSTTNPIAGAVFAIFDTLFAWVVNCIKVIAPKALSVANTVTTGIFNETSNVLHKIVDSVETVKLRAEGTGKEATIQDLLNEAEKSMNEQDKALIQQIKIKMGWK